MDSKSELPENCGMSIAEMKEYLALCLEGESTIPERKIMLNVNAKRQALVEQLQQVQNSIGYIDWKQGFYDDVLSGKIPPRSIYFSLANLSKFHNILSVHYSEDTTRSNLLLYQKLLLTPVLLQFGLP